MSSSLAKMSQICGKLGHRANTCFKHYYQNCNNRGNGQHFENYSRGPESGRFNQPNNNQGRDQGSMGNLQSNTYYILSFPKLQPVWAKHAISAFGKWTEGPTIVGWSHVISLPKPLGLFPIPLLFELKIEDGTYFKILVDTGSQVSVTREDMIPYLHDVKFKLIQLRSVNGHCLFVVCSALLKASIDGNEFSQDVLVVKDVEHPYLLGMDFLNRYVTSRNFINCKMDFKTAVEPNGNVASTNETESIFCK